MNNNAELKETISFDEYKAWLIGLLRGKGNQLPDLNDWRAIKKMTDKVVPDVVEATPQWTVSWEDLPLPEKEPDAVNWFDMPSYGGTGAQDGNNITIRNDNSSVSIHEDGGLTIASGGTFQANGLSIGDKITVSGSYDGSIPEGGFVITGDGLVGGDYGCYVGSHASSYAPHKTSIEDYDFDTSKYTILSAGFDTIKKKKEEE